MQSLILIVLMALVSMFMLNEFNRSSATIISKLPEYIAGDIAANIIVYNDLVIQYAITNYDSLHSLQAINPGHIENVKVLDYQLDNIANFSQKTTTYLANYSSILFNFTPLAVTESIANPVLYLATTWNRYSSDYEGYARSESIEILGQLGQILSKHLYQGNSTYWTVPWVFSQQDCKVTEIFSQLPNDASGNLVINAFKSMFYTFCAEIQKDSSMNYTFLDYVFIEPVFKPVNQ